MLVLILILKGNAGRGIANRVINDGGANRVINDGGDCDESVIRLTAIKKLGRWSTTAFDYYKHNP